MRRVCTGFFVIVTSFGLVDIVGDFQTVHEGCGDYCWRMVAEIGWDIFPIGSGDTREDMPERTLAGIVMIQEM